MTKPLQILIPLVVIALLGVGVWWGIVFYDNNYGRPYNTNNTNSIKQNPSSTNTSITKEITRTVTERFTDLGMDFVIPKTMTVEEKDLVTTQNQQTFHTFTLILRDSSIGESLIISNEARGFETETTIQEGTTTLDGYKVRWLLTKAQTADGKPTKFKRYLFVPYNDGNQYSEYWILFPADTTKTARYFESFVTTISFGTGYGYHLTNEITNPYTRAKYAVRKWVNEEFCGVNGSGACDLVTINDDGTITAVKNLFFAEGPKARHSQQGARLVKFTDRSKLMMTFGNYDHGGGYKAIGVYDLKSDQLEIILREGITETSEGIHDIDMYSIEKNNKKIWFVNDRLNYDSVPNSAGIFLGTERPFTKVEGPDGPYTIDVDLIKNTENAKNVIAITLNGKDYIFDTQSNHLKRLE